MHKRDITYKNFDDEDVTETFFFNLSEPEMHELEAEKKGGFSGWMQEILKMDDQKTIFEQFKRIILMSYGEKSDDGRLFLKKDENGRPLGLKFEQHAAYISLFNQLTSDEAEMAKFITGVLPQAVRDQMAKNAAESSPASPPAVTGAQS